MITPGSDHELSGALETSERVCEVLFGLIMTLTITGSLSVAEIGRGEVRTMLYGVLGCNLAWGLIDGIMYLIGCLNQRGRSMRLLAKLHRVTDEQEGCAIVRHTLPRPVQSVMKPEEINVLRLQLLRMPLPEGRPRLHKDDWRGATEAMLLVLSSAVPVVLPFALIHDLYRAMRVSNAIAIAMLFGAGWLYGRSTGLHSWVTGLVMVLVGGTLVAITMALGG